jgi:pyrimidine-specific ribonucleoside hydrolase
MRGTIAIIGVSALLLGGCTSGDGDARTPVVVDTDMGQDDMMALLYLLQRPDLRVEAITVSGTGLAHCEAGVGIALSLLDVADAPDDVPVACGPETPLRGTYPFQGAFPTSWREATDDAYGIELTESARQPSELPAPEILAAAIHDAGAPVELLALGPLTNVALALRRDPAIVDDLEGVTIMGGALDVPGNVIRNAVAEWNIWVDPVSAREVFDSGAEITLVPLDATNEAPVTPFFADALAGHHVTPEADTVQALFESQPYLLAGQYSFWDPLSAAILSDPALASVRDRRVSVLEGEKATQGQIVDDPDGATIRVATDPDALAFEREFLNTLNGDDAVTSTRPEPVAAITVDDSGCSYEGPANLPTELVGVTLDNLTSRTWAAVLVSIGGGHTYEEVEALVAAFEPTAPPPPWVTVVSATTQAPGTNGLVPWTLERGSYALICQSPDALQAVDQITAG